MATHSSIVVFLPGKSHGREAWQAAVHGVAESDTSQLLSNNIVDFQYCVGFRCTAKRVSYTCKYTHCGFLSVSFLTSALQRTGWRVPCAAQQALASHPSYSSRCAYARLSLPAIPAHPYLQGTRSLVCAYMILLLFHKWVHFSPSFFASSLLFSDSLVCLFCYHESVLALSYTLLLIQLLISFFALSLTFFSLLALYRYGNQLCHWLYLASHKEFSSQEGQTRVYGCIRQIHSTYIKAGAKKPMQNSCSTSVGIVISWHTTHIPLMFAIYLFSHMCSTWHPSSLTRDGAHAPYKGRTEP